MNITDISHAAGQLLTPSQRGLSLDVDDQLLRGLRMGDILEGRVLRRYDSSRHLVDFGGRERVVDSAIPLKTSELIRGKVVGISDKIYLQRLVSNPLEAEHAKTAINEAIPPEARAGINKVFDRYLEKLNDAELARLVPPYQTSGNPEHLLTSAVALCKLGLPLEPRLLRGIEQIRAPFGMPPAKEAAELHRHAIVVEVDGAPLADPESAVAARADAGAMIAQFTNQALDLYGELAAVGSDIESALDLGTATAQGGDSGARQGSSDWWQGMATVNQHSGAATEHRFIVLPIRIDGHVVELNMALFAESRTPVANGGARHRRFVLSLDLPALGPVSADITLTEKRLRATVGAADAESLDFLAAHLGELRKSIEAMGWTLEALEYQVLPADRASSDAVVNHLITQDSLDRLI